MPNLRPLDERVPIQEQLHDTTSPAILVNIFSIAPGDVEEFLAAWERDANWMKRQPGYISTQLHRGLAGSCVFLNYAVWESVAHFRQAFTHPEFRNAIATYPSSVVASPHLFAKVGIPNLCTS
jgi:heme-degrading monooxygenase HmoA